MKFKIDLSATGSWTQKGTVTIDAKNKAEAIEYGESKAWGDDRVTWGGEDVDDVSVAIDSIEEVSND